MKTDALLRPASFPAQWGFLSDRRAYSMTLEVDLFQGFWLLRRWSGRFNRRGGGKREQFAALPQALQRVQEVSKVRLRRGYALTQQPSFKAAPEARDGNEAAFAPQGAPLISAHRYRGRQRPGGTGGQGSAPKKAAASEKPLAYQAPELVQAQLF